MTSLADYERYVERCRLEDLRPFTPVGYRIASRPYDEREAWKVIMPWVVRPGQVWKRKHPTGGFDVETADDWWLDGRRRIGYVQPC